MFATILRRWRLSAPLALVLVSIVVGAMVSAHAATGTTGAGTPSGAHYNLKRHDTTCQRSA